MRLRYAFSAGLIGVLTYTGAAAAGTRRPRLLIPADGGETFDRHGGVMLFTVERSRNAGEDGRHSVRPYRHVDDRAQQRQNTDLRSVARNDSLAVRASHGVRGPQNNAFPLTKPAQAMEVRS
jgi:hypothetical protein